MQIETASLQRGVEVWLDDPDDYQKYLHISDSDVPVESWASRNFDLFYSLKMEKFLITILLSLTLLISSFAIITVLVLLGTQKQRDMGLLMSLGLSAKKTHYLMVNMSFMLSGLGVFLGLALGVAITLVLDEFSFLQLPDIYYDTKIPAKLDFLGIGLITLLATSVSFLSAWLPALLTVEKSPALSLRSRF